MKTIDVEQAILNRNSVSYNTNNDVCLSRLEVLDILYNELPCICDLDEDRNLDSSKYVRLARHYQYRNYRLFKYSDIRRLGLQSSLSQFHHKFISDCGGAVICILNSLNGKAISCVFRGITTKDFVDYSALQSLYGFDMLEDSFRYGDWLVLAEGFYDADVLRTIYPNVVAMQTSNVNALQSQILLTMTDKFIVAFDSDTAGHIGFDKALKRLKKDNTIVQHLKVYGDDKDVGILGEIISNKEEYSKRLEYYTKSVHMLMKGNILGW